MPLFQTLAKAVDEPIDSVAIVIADTVITAHRFFPTWSLVDDYGDYAQLRTSCTSVHSTALMKSIRIKRAISS